MVQSFIEKEDKLYYDWYNSYSEEEQRKDAYRLKNKEIGYKPELQLEESY